MALAHIAHGVCNITSPGFVSKHERFYPASKEFPKCFDVNARHHYPGTLHQADVPIVQLDV